MQTRSMMTQKASSFEEEPTDHPIEKATCDEEKGQPKADPLNIEKTQHTSDMISDDEESYSQETEDQTIVRNKEDSEHDDEQVSDTITETTRNRETMQKQKLGAATMFLACALSASWAPAFKLIYQQDPVLFTPFRMSFLQQFAGLVILLPIFWKKHTRLHYRFSRRVLISAVAAEGLDTVIGPLLESLALRSIGLDTHLALNQITPILLVCIAWVTMGCTPNKWSVVNHSIVVFGVILFMMFPRSSFGLHKVSVSIDLSFQLLSSICYVSGSMIRVLYLQLNVPISFIVISRIIIGVVMMFLLLIIVEGPSSGVKALFQKEIWKVMWWWSPIYGALTILLFSFGEKYCHPFLMSIAMSTAFPLTLIFKAALLGEAPSLPLAVAGVFIQVAVISNLVSEKSLQPGGNKNGATTTQQEDNPKDKRSIRWQTLVFSLLVCGTVAVSLLMSALSGGKSKLQQTDDLSVICQAQLGPGALPCPNAQVKFEESTEKHPKCKVGIIGAGPSGVYTAMLLIRSEVVSPRDVCIFEMSSRVGGRVYSLRGFGEHSLTVDTGGYRMSKKDTPLTLFLATEILGLSVTCYDENDPCVYYNVADEEGKKNGYGTVVETMMRDIVKRGVRFFPHYKLHHIERKSSSSPALLEFRGGAQADIENALILTVDQRGLLEIVRKSVFPKGLVGEETINALHSVQSQIATKVYLYYSDAWWLRIGLTEGNFKMEGDAQKMPLAGRYHDGDYYCIPCGEFCYGIKRQCHGFLLAFYGYDFGGANSLFMRNFRDAGTSPITIISNNTVEGGYFLNHAHSRIIQYHKDILTREQLRELELKSFWQEPPDFAVVSVWDSKTDGFGGAWHIWTNLTHKDTAVAPFAEADIHTVNEAFSDVQSWVEGGLRRADELLKTRWGVESPWEFKTDDIEVRTTNTGVEQCNSDKSTCAGSKSCGLYVANRGCQCNEYCVEYDNCCPDYAPVCLESMQLCSIYQSCGRYVEENDCQCNELCETFENCCADYQAICTSAVNGDVRK